MHRESQRNITRARTKISQIRIINTCTLVKNIHIKHACTLFYLHDEINFDRTQIHVIKRKFSQRTELIHLSHTTQRTNGQNLQNHFYRTQMITKKIITFHIKLNITQKYSP